MEPRETAYVFLQALFGDDLDGRWLLIWTNPGKKSAWFQNVEDAALYASRQNGVNCYFGICASPDDFGASGRCSAGQVAVIPGLWADIDIADVTAHSKDNIPATLAEARALVEALPLAPTITVHSGHGLQCYWLFKEPWDIDNDVERAEAAAIARGWHETIMAEAKRRGKVIDATWDLARVFRVPGTANVKDPTHPQSVTILEHFDERRYNPDDFSEYFPEDVSSYAVEMERDRRHLDIRLSRDPLVNQAKLEAMWDMEPKAKATWLHKRKDLEGSMSSYDMALAAYAVQCSWTDQEVADLIIAFRQKHGTEKDIKKAFRLDYMSLTIKNARAKYGRAEAEIAADAALAETNARLMENTLTREDATTTAPKGMPAEHAKQIDSKKIEAKPSSRPPEDKKKLLEAISAKLGVPVRRVIKYLADPPCFALIIGKGVEIKLGRVQNLIRLGNLQGCLAEGVGIMIPGKIKGWEQVAQGLLNAVELVPVGEESTAEGRVREWLVSYLDEQRASSDWEACGKSRNPYRRDGRTYIFLQELRSFLGMRGDKITQPELATELRRFGCEPVVQWFEIEGKKTTRNVYAIPDLDSRHSATDRLAS